jgi:hypothetical protein
MDTLLIRNATLADRKALDRLAALDGLRLPAGPLLVAVVDGELVAALGIHSGQAVAHPFRRTADALQMLRIQARAMQGEPIHRSLVERLGLRGGPMARAA